MTRSDPRTVAIVGQGLAGTAVAWALHRRGCPVVMFDDGAPTSASRVSAGLITPITGRRFTAEATAADIDAACAFYEAAGRALGIDILTRNAAQRIIADAEEQEVWEKRRTTPTMAAHIVAQELRLNPAHVSMTHGAFAMRAARLEAAPYLAASRDHFGVVDARLDGATDIRITPNGVRVLGQPCRAVVIATGWTPDPNPLFPDLAISGSRGDILTVEMPELDLPGTLHKGIWIAPTRTAGHFRVGATFAWDRLTDGPLPQARAELERRLAETVRVPFKVVDHAAGVRPVARGRGVVMRPGPLAANVIAFNGFGAKGALRAALAAPRLASHILDGTPLWSARAP
jgi:glycine oxidase